MKRKQHISKTSLSDIIFLMMSNTGMTREQAAVTLDNILAYMKQHRTDPLAKLTKAMFGLNRDTKSASLN